MPAGGAMIITEYWPLDVFRPGLLSNVWSLGMIRHFMAELQQFPFPWRNIELCQATKDTFFNENSRSSQFNIAKAFRVDWPNIMLMSLNCLESSLQHKTCQFLLSAGGAMTITEYGHVFGTGLLSNVKFGADRTLSAWIITTSYFMVKHRSLSGHHGHALQRKLKIFAI